MIFAHRRSGLAWVFAGAVLLAVALGLCEAPQGEAATLPVPQLEPPLEVPVLRVEAEPGGYVMSLLSGGQVAAYCRCPAITSVDILITRVDALAVALGTDPSTLQQAGITAAPGVSFYRSAGGLIVACAEPSELEATVTPRGQLLLQVTGEGTPAWRLAGDLGYKERADLPALLVIPQLRGDETAEGVVFASTPHEALLGASLESSKEPRREKWALLQAAGLLRELSMLEPPGTRSWQDVAAVWSALAGVVRFRPQHMTVQALAAIVETAAEGAGPERSGALARAGELAEWLLTQQYPEAAIAERFTDGRHETGALGKYWLGKHFETPSLYDTDADGLPDWFELVAGSSPFARDTDGDGQDDTVEALMGTDPRMPPALPPRGPLIAGAYSPVRGGPERQDIALAAGIRRKVAYLTFDDGPSPDMTPQVLDVLARRNVKATFFLIGVNAARNPKLVRRMKDEGHSVGNHTSSHDYRSIYASPQAYANSLDACGDTLFRITGSKTVLTRPPGGNASHFTQQYWSILKARGYRSVGWNVYGRDAVLPRVPSSGIVQAVLEGARRAEADVVVLLHDGSGHASTVKALDAIVDGLLDLGFVFDRIDDAASVPTAR